jgi:hypothetical protein
MEAHMKPWKRILLLVIDLLTILSLLLTACGPVEKSHGNSNKDKDGAKNENHGKGKYKNKGDTNSNADKVLICHKTGSAKHRYVEISVPNDALKDGHAKHEGDLIPAPEDGCPVQ